MTIETAAGVEQSAHLKSMGHMGAPDNAGRYACRSEAEGAGMHAMAN